MAVHTQHSCAMQGSTCEDRDVPGDCAVRWTAHCITQDWQTHRREMLQSKSLDQVELLEPEHGLALPESSWEVAGNMACYYFPERSDGCAFMPRYCKEET